MLRDLSKLILSIISIFVPILIFNLVKYSRKDLSSNVTPRTFPLAFTFNLFNVIVFLTGIFPSFDGIGSPWGSNLGKDK